MPTAGDQLADSINALPALVGEPETQVWKSLILVPRSASHVSVRKGNWMYIPSRRSGGSSGKPGTHGVGGPKAVSFVANEHSDFENGVANKDTPKAQLYNLDTDITQTTNRYDIHPGKVQEMKSPAVNRRARITGKSRAAPVNVGGSKKQEDYFTKRLLL